MQHGSLRELLRRALSRDSGVLSLAAAVHAGPSMHYRGMPRATALRPTPCSALVHKFQVHCKALCSCPLRWLQASLRPAMLGYRRRSAVPCPIVPAAPARAAALCTRQLAGARMCSCRACAGSWQCVVECASLGRSRVCSRARVGVCRAGAAERAHSRWKRFARSRVVELPDVAASARAPAMAHCSRKVLVLARTQQYNTMPPTRRVPSTGSHDTALSSTT